MNDDFEICVNEKKRLNSPQQSLLSPEMDLSVK